MDAARERLPILYVDAIPVRLDPAGELASVGLLLRVTGAGRSSGPSSPAGCCMASAVRAALLRHVEKDLGPLALPRVPPSCSRSRWPSTFRRPA